MAQRLSHPSVTEPIDYGERGRKREMTLVRPIDSVRLLKQPSIHVVSLKLIPTTPAPKTPILKQKAYWMKRTEVEEVPKFSEYVKRVNIKYIF